MFLRTLFNRPPKVVKTYVQGVESSIMIGLYDSEKTKPQRISVDAEMWSYSNPNDTSGLSEQYVDYDLVRDLVLNVWPERPHTDMIETLAAELLDHCLKHPKVYAARVNISKLDLDNTRKAGIELCGRSDSVISRWVSFGTSGPKLT